VFNKPLIKHINHDLELHEEIQIGNVVPWA